ESHVLLALSGEARPMNLPIPEHAILLADELLPSELVALERRRLAAICLSGGGATSHVAILAAAMDVPMLVGLGAPLRGIADGAEGCGLRRTEFLFSERDTAPSEAEQLESYQAIADALGGRPLVLRLMDIGGDKPLRYLPLPYEENPALGLRGIRTALWRKDL